MPIIQSLAQLEKNYGKEGVEVITNNCNMLTVRSGETSGWTVLDFTTDLDRTHAQRAGQYSDTLTFTVTVG